VSRCGSATTFAKVTRRFLLLSMLLGAAPGLGCQERASQASVPPPALRHPEPSHANLIPATAAPPIPKPKPPGFSIYAKTRFVWIYPEATTDSKWMGYLWTGGSARLKSLTPVYGKGCETAWYAIEPRGFICANNKHATLNGEDEIYLAAHALAGDLNSPWPHQYAEAQGTALKRNTPVTIDFPLANVAPPLLLPAFSAGVYEPYVEFKRRSTIAFVKELRAGDQDWLITADLRWVSRASVTHFARSEFEGVHLSESTTLPLAFFRSMDRPQYRRTAGGNFEPTGENWPRLGWVPLTLERFTEGSEVFRKLAQDDRYMLETDAVIPEPRRLTPWNAEVGKPDTTGQAPAGRATWIETSVNGGWLIAYAGTRPVFTTLVSAGRGGIPLRNIRAIDTASTPTGAFHITGKFATATMTNNAGVHTAVPWTQNFTGPYSFHTAYWHDDFGDLRSGGCINLSPKDAHYLFGFTEPALPEGWHGMRRVPQFEPATWVSVIP